jgi:hypothetical protein
MSFLPGVDLNKICDGRTLGSLWEFYTINVKKLGTMTHEQFVLEFPEAAKEIERASKIMDRLNELVQE